MKKTIITIGFTLTALLFSIDVGLANEASNEIFVGYELVCELVEMENGDTSWSCDFVQVTRSVDVSVVGSGGGASNTLVYLMCYEHHENGMPTGETMTIRVL